MKKLLLLFAAILMASTGMWAETQTVSYRYPVYNTDGDPASGIKEWKTSETEAIVLTASSDQVTLYEPWYVITGTNVQCYAGIVILGNVNLILADGAKLTALGTVKNAGIQVSGVVNSLTIYGQDNQSGRLEVTGGNKAAGIGGGSEGSGSNITINGGTITANGGDSAAGIGGGFDGSGSNITINGGTITANGDTYAAGIGGGSNGSGSNIIINGGKVTANGGTRAAGIGGGKAGSGSNIIINGGTVTANGGDGDTGIGGGHLGDGSNIFIATDLIIKADNNDPPETVITNTGGDLASSLAGNQYVKIDENLPLLRAAAIDEINAAIEGVTDTNVHAIANTAITNIDKATSKAEINFIKQKALADIAFAITKLDAIAEITSAGQGIKNAEINNWIDAAINDIKRGSQGATPSIDEIKEQILYMINLFQNGKAEGKADALGTMGEKQNGTVVKVTGKDDMEIILYSPKKVEYIKMNE